MVLLSVTRLHSSSFKCLYTYLHTLTLQCSLLLRVVSLPAYLATSGYVCHVKIVAHQWWINSSTWFCRKHVFSAVGSFDFGGNDSDDETISVISVATTKSRGAGMSKKKQSRRASTGGEFRQWVIHKWMLKCICEPGWTGGTLRVCTHFLV